MISNNKQGHNNNINNNNNDNNNINNKRYNKRTSIQLGCDIIVVSLVLITSHYIDPHLSLALITQSTICIGISDCQICN